LSATKINLLPEVNNTTTVRLSEGGKEFGTANKGKSRAIEAQLEVSGRDL